MADFENNDTARQTAVLTWTRGESGREDGAAYDGSVALKCREVTSYDASERFRMLIRHKTGTFYDGNSAFNMERGLKVLEARFPNSHAVRNTRAHLAVLGCKPAVARTYFERLDGRVDLSVWESKEDFVKKANWAFGR